MVEITELMTPNPVWVPAEATIVEAAQRMRDDDIGALLVMKGGAVTGIVTDRDIVVRSLAGGFDPSTTPVATCASADLVTVSPTDNLDHALRLMRDHALRRIPVVDGGRPIGMLTMGDIAIDREPASVLADVSGAPPNH